MPKTDWPVKTLGEVAELNPSEPALSDNAPFVPMDAVTAGKRQVQYTQPRGQRSGARARAGDILFARITPCLQNGKVALIQDDIERCGGSTEFIVVRAGPEVLRGVLYQWITAEHVRDHLTALMKGTTGRQRLDARDLASTELPVPPLDEQKRIVALLDDVTARITELTACYEEARAHVNNLFASTLRDVLESNPDWPVKTLGDVCDFQNGYAFRSSEFVKNGHALIRIKNVQQGEIIPSDDAYVRIPSDGSLDEFVLNAGDILISLTGHLGRVGRIGRSDLPAALNQRVAKVRMKSPETMCDGFLFRILDSRWFRDQVEMFGRGAAQQNVGTSDISKIKIAVPPVDEQKQIVARLDQLRAKTSEMVAAYDAKLQAAKNLRQSILEAAFAGEL